MAVIHRRKEVAQSMFYESGSASMCILELSETFMFKFKLNDRHEMLRMVLPR